MKRRKTQKKICFCSFSFVFVLSFLLFVVLFSGHRKYYDRYEPQIVFGILIYVDGETASLL